MTELPQPSDVKRFAPVPLWRVSGHRKVVRSEDIEVIRRIRRAPDEDVIEIKQKDARMQLSIEMLDDLIDALRAAEVWEDES